MFNYDKQTVYKLLDLALDMLLSDHIKPAKLSNNPL